MMKLCFVLSALLAMLAAPAAGSMTCNLAGVPLQVSAEGLAEPVGEILLQCSGGPPNSTLTGSFQIFLNMKVANGLAEDGTYTGMTLAQEFPGSIFLTLPAMIRPLGESILFEQFQIPINGQGFFSIKFGGIRANAISTTQAFLQFTGNQQLLINNFNSAVTVARAQTTVYATHVGAEAAGLGPMLPSTPDFNSMIVAHVPMATTRITEGWANAFVPRKGYDSNGTRIMIRLSGVPEGARIFAPDAIAGTGALQPTQSGDMGSYPASGLYVFTPTGSLLLSRIRSTNPDGSGGFANYYPVLGTQSLANVREVEPVDGTPYLVYETMDANPAQRESAQIPIWIVLPSDRFATPSVVRQTISLAPLSNQPGSVANAPIPRYRAAPVESDCSILGDCAAPYFPKMTVTPPEVTEFTAPAGSGNIAVYFLLHNTGAGLLEWRVSARYRGSATGWLSVSPDAGFNNRTVRFDLFPAALTPGRYEGEIIVQQVGAPTGGNAQTVIPVVLNVTEALPPPIPLPSITDILDAANRWPMPEAPGSLVVITGVNFGENTSVTIGGSVARIVLRSDTEMLVEVPLGLPAGPAEVIPANSGRPGPSRMLDLVLVAPATLFVLNSDDERNSEEHAAETGKLIQVYMTGIRGAAQPLSVKIHDRYLDVESSPTDQPGVDLVKFTVPGDFPTMPSVVVVCAAPASGGEASCSHPKDIWVKAAAE